MLKLTITSIVFYLIVTASMAQSFTGTQKNQGYGVFSNNVTFIFDEALYGVRPNRVVVTGEFRNWDQNMDDVQWQLSKTGEQWLLTFDNSEYTVIAPGSKFKFRIDNGEWL